MIDFLFALPLWALALVLNGWLMGFALVSLWAYRRWVASSLRLGSDATLFYAAAMMQSAIMLYGLVAALTAVSVWQTHSQVADTASREATAISSLWRDFGGYPPRERDGLREILRGYTNQIITEAWPAQKQGRVLRSGVEWVDRLQEQLFAYQPSSESQKILHAETLAAYNRMAEARRQRIDAVNTGLPAVMWLVLLPGAMGCLLFSLFFPVDDIRLHGILMAGLAGFMAMVLFVIVSLDRPFIGDLAITPDSYQAVHDQLMKK